MPVHTWPIRIVDDPGVGAGVHLDSNYHPYALVGAANDWTVTASHELLVGYLAEFYKEFSSAEIMAIDQLRKTRNDIAYRGVMIKAEYLTRRKADILKIIEKLKSMVVNK